MKQSAIRAEELLLLVEYGLELFTMPTLRKWNESYEGWLYQKGLLGRLHYLEKQKFLLRELRKGEWTFKLTDAGRVAFQAGGDPEPLWQRSWDGVWRQLVFDLPVNQQPARVALLRWLRRHRFGYLQDSVWISPDPIQDVAATLKDYRDQADAFTILECRCAPGFSNAALVLGAWPFDHLAVRYDGYLEYAAEARRRLQRDRLHPRDLFSLLRDERLNWQQAVARDPFLPQALWPKGYAGKTAWQARRRLLQAAATQIAT